MFSTKITSNCTIKWDVSTPVTLRCHDHTVTTLGHASSMPVVAKPPANPVCKHNEWCLLRPVRVDQ